MFFDFIIKNNTFAHPQINKALLWDYDFSEFDWTAMRRTVVQRVVERGSEEDYLALFRLYGGMEGVKQIIKDEVPWLSAKDVSFVCRIFGLKKENLKCYTRTQSRAKLLSY
jgi:hypothetical protein